MPRLFVALDGLSSRGALVCLLSLWLFSSLPPYGKTLHHDAGGASLWKVTPPSDGQEAMISEMGNPFRGSLRGVTFSLCGIVPFPFAGCPFSSGRSIRIDTVRPWGTPLWRLLILHPTRNFRNRRGIVFLFSSRTALFPGIECSCACRSDNCVDSKRPLLWTYAVRRFFLVVGSGTAPPSPNPDLPVHS